MRSACFSIVFLLSLFTALSIVVETQSVYPEVVVHYNSFIKFENFTVRFLDADICLNGIIHGRLYARYVFREDAVVVSLKYINYTLNGFEDFLSRQYVISKLAEKPVYVFSRNEQPYELSKPFVVEGGTKYYVSPNNLESSGVVEQSVSFILGNYTILREKRFFKYDLATGILIELLVNSQIYVGRLVVSNYTIRFEQTYFNYYRLGINQIDRVLTYLLSAIVIVATTVNTYIMKRVGEKTGDPRVGFNE